MSKSTLISLNNEEVVDEVFSETALDAMEDVEKEEYEADFDDSVIRNDEEVYMKSSSLNLFLKEVANVPLLTAEEEAELAKKAMAGNKAARDRLIEANIRLVVSIAKRYRGCGLDFEDLVQEGILGLMNGIKRYDYSKGFRVSTYVTYWIRQSIGRAITECGRSIRLPAHMTEKINKLKKEVQRLTLKLGYEPDTAAIAKALKMKRSEVEDLMTLSMTVSSLDAPIGDDENMVLGDTVRNENSCSIENIIEAETIKQELYEMLETLPDREREIIELRFGLNGEEESTLETVGKKYNLTRERVRQIEATAIRRLRRVSADRLAS